MKIILDLAEKSLVLERNHYLKVAGSIDTQIYFIEEGSLKIYVLNDGCEHIIRFGYRGDLVVSLDSFLTRKASEFYIQAIKKTTLKVISKNSFDAFIKSNDQNKDWWISILENLVVQQIEREKDLLIISPVERYQRVLARSPQLFQEIPNRYIANYLRMSAETLSRLKKS